jgi:hypothetical protein
MFFFLVNYCLIFTFLKGQLSLQRAKSKGLKLLEFFLGGSVLSHLCLLAIILKVP